MKKQFWCLSKTSPSLFTPVIGNNRDQGQVTSHAEIHAQIRERACDLCASHITFVYSILEDNMRSTSYVDPNLLALTVYD